MTAINYDCEFVEDGKTIDLLSIGMVAANGDELYQVVDDPATIWRAVEHPWVGPNVVPHLPVTVTADAHGRWSWFWDDTHPDIQQVAPRWKIAGKVKDFIRSFDAPDLWADWSAYDHVALCQLWGSMVALPEGIPMFTHDFRHEVHLLGNPDVPAMPGVVAHRSLDDARELKWRREWLAANYDPGGPRWPSMRLVKDVDDFTLGLDEDGEMAMWCPSGECGGGHCYESGPVRLGSILAGAYEHIDEHKAAGR
jgi:hypothetical protein